VYYAFAWAAIFFVIGVMLTAVWWTIAPHAGLVPNTNPPLIVAEQVTSPGSVLTYTVSYCVDESLPLPITVDRTLELQLDGAEPVSWPVAPPIQYTIENRCETKTRLLGIPSFIIPGKYHIHSVSSLTVNPIRIIRQTWQSNDFRIIGPPHSEAGESLPVKK